MRKRVGGGNEDRRLKVAPEEIVALYESGLTAAEIGKRFGVSKEPITRLLREAGAKMRPAKKREGVGAGVLNPAWKGGRRQRRDGYVIVWTPNGDRLEHRVVMETQLSRPLMDSEVVHHKDGDPSNNRVENLELLDSQRTHALRHGADNRAVLLQHGLKQCTVCLLVKPIAEFYATPHNKMGIQSWCKMCKNARDSQRRKERRKNVR